VTTRQRFRLNPPVQLGKAYPDPNVSYLGVQDQGSVVIRSDRCNDTVGQWEDVNPLFIEHYDGYVGDYSGRDGQYYTADQWATLAYPHHLDPTTPAPSQNAQLSHVLANSAPFTPEWYGLDAILQLKDFRNLPRQIRDMGGDILSGSARRTGRTVANGQLLATFGIAPFISDLQKSLDFVDRANRRFKDLEAMKRPEGASKNQTSYRDHAGPTFQGIQYYTGLYFASARGKLYLSTERKSWCTITWNINPSALPDLGDPANHARASAIANGYAFDPHTLWDLMPWTWLIDWFTNMDDFIRLSNNICKASSGRYAIMEHARSKFTMEYYDGSRGLWRPGKGSYTTSYRTPLFTALPEIHLPFITSGMASILTSLTSQRLL
jgi:hypothetical protein